MRFQFHGLFARTSSRRRQSVVPVAAELVESRIVLSPMTGVAADDSDADAQSTKVAEKVEAPVADAVQQTVKVHVGARPVSDDHADVDALKAQQNGVIQNSPITLTTFDVTHDNGIVWVEGWVDTPVGETDIILGGVLDGYEIPVDISGYFIGGFMDVPAGVVEGTAVDEFGNTSNTEVRLLVY